MPKIKINDINLYYETYGAGEPLIFIAGFSADHQAWYSIVEKFAADYQVILFDNRGVGQTDIPAGPYSISQMAKDVAVFCETLKIKKANFVGNSMGGYIVQTLAAHYPKLVKKIVISNSAMITDSPFHIYVEAQLEFLKANAPIEQIIKASCAWAFSFQFLMQPGKLAELIQLTMSNPYPFTITGYEGQYAALDNFNSSDWAHQIQAPTLILTSDQDLILPARLSIDLAAQIPNSEIYLFENCGHLPHMEYPEKYAEILQNFLKKRT